MKYYLKRLGHQELGSVKNGKAQRGRYIYISKDKNVLDIFPPLSKTVTNDSSIIPIIPLYFVMTGYKQKCAITGNVIQYKSFMNLEAAHIWPRSHKGLYLPSNGIALCRDMHWAFDKGMFTIGDDFKVIVHPDVESDYLQQYNNKSLYIPENAFFRPDINNLHYHQTHIYGLFKTSGSLVKATGYYKNINMAAEDKTPYGSN